MREEDSDITTERLPTLNLRQPDRLVVVLGGAEGGVEEDEEQNQPVERHRFDGGAAVPATHSVPPPQRPTAERQKLRFKLT